jgi:hypothetical protein
MGDIELLALGQQDNVSNSSSIIKNLKHASNER